jgi:hypothetical protein
MDKKEALVENGTFNRNHEKVKRSKFLAGGFYDPTDIMQVKYEMLRDAMGDIGSIEALSGEYGYTRASYYNIREAFDRGGVMALAHGKTGPKEPRKLTREAQAHIEGYTAGHPSASANDIRANLVQDKGIQVSKRTVERHMAKKKLR